MQPVGSPFGTDKVFGSGFRVVRPEMPFERQTLYLTLEIVVMRTNRRMALYLESIRTPGMPRAIRVKLPGADHNSSKSIPGLLMTSSRIG